jgi:hypothetical protein
MFQKHITLASVQLRSLHSLMIVTIAGTKLTSWVGSVVIEATTATRSVEACFR